MIHVPNIYIPSFIEKEAIVRLQPKGFVTVSAIRPDGTEKVFFKEKQNTILDVWRDQTLAMGGVNAASGHWGGYFFAQASGSTTIYAGSDGSATNSKILNSLTVANDVAVGGPLNGYIRSLSTQVTTGNGVSLDATTGNLVINIRHQAASVEVGTVTYREAAFVTGGGPSQTTFSKYFNRVVFPSDVILNAGDLLTVSMSIVIPLPTVNALTISVPSSGGMDISGQLKLIGSINSVFGCDIAANAAISNVTASPTTAGSGCGGCWMPNSTSSGATTPTSVFGLTTASSFPTSRADTTGMNTNLATTSAWNTYVRGSFTRDCVGTWNSASGPFTFQSITLSQKSGTCGYQLLCNSSQTKVVGKTLIVGLRFTL